MEQYYLNTELDNIDNEEWIDIMGFDGIYEVSNYGRVKSVGRWVGANNGGERWVKRTNIETSNRSIKSDSDPVCRWHM